MSASTSVSLISKVLTWFDDHIMLILTGFLLAFIPLYPKLPLFEAIPGYIVRVRLEDIIVFGTGITWLIQALRGKINWRVTSLWLLITYALIGLFSLISAVFLIKTIPLQLLHVGKSVLHYFRYLEYFSLVLFVFAAVKSKADAVKLLTISFLTVLALSIYGYGQKFFYWPVYSTMNREFSKGIRLYLMDHARVQSTFGGHYDLAAYLVISLPIILALAFSVKSKLLKVSLHLLHIIGLWLLLVAAARTSYIGYLVALGILIPMLALKQPTWPKKISWAITRGLGIGILMLVMILNFGQDISERLVQALEGYPAANKFYHDSNIKYQDLIHQPLVALGLAQRPAPPSDGVGVSAADQVLTPTDTRPVSQKPSDVFTVVPETVTVATTSASGVTTTTTVNKDRTYSDNALKYGLSAAIRFDTLWPRAIAGFWRNPLLGSGYATLTKESITQFTEAESTDNNFLRTLGETGLLGFLSFYGLVVLAIMTGGWLFNTQTGWIMALGGGFVAASVGLLLNASYIDVFASSKVAFTYWSMVGLILALRKLVTKPIKHADS